MHRLGAITSEPLPRVGLARWAAGGARRGAPARAASSGANFSCTKSKACRIRCTKKLSAR